MKIKKNDKVLVIKGKDRGKTGVVDKVLPKANKIVVAGLNIYKKSMKASRKNPQGGIADLNMPMNVSNVKLICPQCNKTTKIGYKITGKSKMRICRKCKETLNVK